MSERKSFKVYDLEGADKILKEYSELDSFIDSGNLFYAAGEYKEAYKELQEKLSVALECINKVDAHTEEYDGVTGNYALCKLLLEYEKKIMGEKK